MIFIFKYLSYSKKTLTMKSLVQFINEASDANNTNALLDAFIEEYKKYDEDEPTVISIEEADKIHEKFENLIEPLDPEVRSFGRIQGLFRKRKPFIMFENIDYAKSERFEDTGKYFELSIMVPEGKIHWPTYEIGFYVHVSEKNGKNKADYEKIDVYCRKLDLYKSRGAYDEDAMYYVRLLDESAIDRLKELD